MRDTPFPAILAPMQPALETGPIVEKILAVHGGRERWESLYALEAEVSARGLLFAFKRRPALCHASVTAMAREPHFLFHDYPSPGMTGELIGNEEVRILGSAGRVVERRACPRAQMNAPGKLLGWDDLDFVYFGGYATWNYLMLPRLLLHDGVQVAAVPPRRGMPATWTCLRVRFPESLPTHSATQLFFFDERLHLRRQEYVAEVVGAWARAAHFCEDYRNFNGFKAPTRRRVRPMIPGNIALPGPTLVALDVHLIRAEYDP
ncbi:MAG TPA: hypothetical protein VI078_10570 [bacterium]